jgi:hypothetical protein
MANWTPQGYLGRLIDISASYAPAPPEAIPSPLAWGEPEVMRERLGDLAVSVELQPRMAPTRFASKQAALEFQERHNGPLIALRNTLPPERYDALMTDLDQLTDQFNRATDGTVAIDAEYLLVVARKP